MYILYLLVLTGYIFSRGLFSYNSFFMMAGACIIFPIVVVNKNLKDKLSMSPAMLLIVLSVLSIVMYGGLYQRSLVLVIISFVISTANLLIAIKLFVSKDSQTMRKLFWLMIVTSFLLRVLMVWSSPDPYIDVYDYLKNGALGLAAGENPYSIMYTKMYTDLVPDCYPYLPGMIYFTLPFVLILHDPRFAIILAEFLTAFIVYRLMEKDSNRYIFPLLILSNPISLYMIEQSYTEPIILALLVLLSFCIAKNKKAGAAASFGFAIATKQYVVFLLPLVLGLIRNLKEKLFFVAGMSLTAGIVIIPFYLWNSKDFIHDVVFVQNNLPPRYDGLSLFSFLHRFGIEYNFYASLCIILVSLLFVYSRKKISLAQFFNLSSLAYLALFFFNKWSFINYYYLISQLLLVGAIIDGHSKVIKTSQQ